MGDYNIKNTGMSNLTDNVEDFSIPQKNLDSPRDQDETVYVNTDFPKWWGYFTSVADLKSAIIMRAVWNVGKGYTCDSATQVILDHISGNGKQTFLDILFNLEVMKRVNGDSYAEIIREKGIIVNLKVLDPSKMRHVFNKEGRIIRYEQWIGDKRRKLDPKDVLHFSHNCFGDSISGMSDIVSMEKTILAEEENFEDMKKIMHRQARPMIMFKINTQNRADRDAFIAIMDEATNKGENIYIPEDKNTVSYEVIQVNVSNVIMEWRNHIRNKFYRALGLPLVIFGNGGSTESGGKIEYLSHEQIFEHSQKEIEEQLWNQLNIRIDLIPPVSLLESLQTDENKDANQGLVFQQNDVNPTGGR